MSIQIFSQGLQPSLLRSVFLGVRAGVSRKNVHILQGSKKNIVFKPVQCPRYMTNKSSNGGIFASDNVLMFTGLSLLGGIVFYVCKDYLWLSSQVYS